MAALIPDEKCLISLGMQGF